MMDSVLQEKIVKLQEIIKSYGRLAVAFSAGTDSTLLLKAAKEILGSEAVLALTVESALVPAGESSAAREFCQAEGINHHVEQLQPLEVEDVRSNPPERCYFCKRLVFGRLREIAGQMDFVHLADGSNVDDLADYRPGQRAVKELGILSPLREAGFTKADVRAYSRALGLKTADKPAAACLASRIPYGEALTLEKLLRVEQAEICLRELGFEQLRVRSHGELARIELPPADVERFLAATVRERAAAKLRELGFAYVTLDLQGYRMGSLNEVLKGN